MTGLRFVLAFWLSRAAWSRPVALLRTAALRLGRRLLLAGSVCHLDGREAGLCDL
jgi:hypothetical protein